MVFLPFLSVRIQNTLCYIIVMLSTHPTGLDPRLQRPPKRGGGSKTQLCEGMGGRRGEREGIDVEIDSVRRVRVDTHGVRMLL